MIRLTAAFLLILPLNLAALANGGEPGAAGTAERVTWCKQRYEQCVETSKRPGFLGGPLKWCKAGSTDCAGECERRYGTASDCLSSPAPR